MPIRFRYLFPQVRSRFLSLDGSSWKSGRVISCGLDGQLSIPAVNLANQLTPKPRDQQPLLPVAKKASGPIRKAAIDDGIPVSIRRLGRDPQRKGLVVAQTLQTLLIYPESGFRELVTQGFDHFGVEER